LADVKYGFLVDIVDIQATEKTPKHFPQKIYSNKNRQMPKLIITIMLTMSFLNIFFNIFFDFLFLDIYKCPFSKTQFTFWKNS